MQRQKMRNSHCLLRWIAGGMAVVMCFLLTVNAGAVLTVDAAETAGVEADTLLEALDGLRSAADPEIQAAYPDLFKEQSQWNIAAQWLREDVLSGIRKCTLALNTRTSLEAKINGLEDKLTASEHVSPEEAALWMETVRERQGAVVRDPVAELAQGLAALGDTALVTAEADACLAELAGLESSVDALSATADELHRWQNIDTLLEQISGYVMPEEDGAESVYASAREQYLTLVQRRDAGKEAVKDFFTLTQLEQTELAGSIRQLELDTEAFPMTVALDSLSILAAQQDQIEALKTQNQSLSGKMVFAYIALGTAVLGILMAVVAAVFALRSKGDELDVSLLASRADAEALTAQNRSLQTRVEMLDQKLDRVYTDREQTKQNLQEKMDEPKPAKPSLVPQPPIQPVEEPLRGSQRQVCCLTLKYQNTNPDNSYLEADKNGQYVLFDDDTVELRKLDGNDFNELKGWRDSGVLYLFDAQIDGKRLQAGQDMLPGGYYAAVATAERARVTLNRKDSYKLQHRGCVRMKRS